MSRFFPTIPSRDSAIKYPKVTVSDVVVFYWRSIKIHWFSALLSIIGIAVMAVMDIIVPIYYKQFFDIISSGGAVAVIAKELTSIIIFILILNGISWVSLRTSTFANTWFQSNVMSRLRTSAFEYLLDHSYLFFSNNFTGSLTQRINRYARAFEHLIDRIVWDVIPLTIKVVGITIVLWFINHNIAYILLVWALLFMVSNYLLAKWKLKYDVEAAQLDSRLTATLSDAITNHQTIQLFTGQQFEAGIFQNVNTWWRRLSNFRWNVDNVVNGFQAGLMFAIEFFLFYYGIKYWQLGMITIGTFVLIQAYYFSMADRLWNVSRVIRDVYEGFADAKEMVEILKLDHDVKDAPGAKPISVSKGEIDFKNVNFAFHMTRSVLNGISLHVRNGEKIALVGPSGAGKSTFVRLLLRLYDLESGEITIDGQNIAHVTQDSLRHNISLVPQDPVLFHRTLLENIRYGRRSATDTEVMEAAKLAHCDDFIESLPNKYETYVGERGIKLSGGERQRVAIARAILKNAPILILDEATSSLDSHSEMLIQDALDTLMKSKTTIVIAHRLSTIKKMDRIIVVDNGKIVEEGTHDALAEKAGGLYAKLWSLQAGGFLKE